MLSQPQSHTLKNEPTINSRRREHIANCAAKARKMSIDQIMSKTQTAARAFTEKLKALWPVLQCRILEGESSGSRAGNEINTVLSPD